MIRTLASPRLAQIFEHLNGSYLLLTADFTIVAATDSYLTTTNCARPDVLGQRVLDVFTSHIETDRQGIGLLRNSLEYVVAHKKPHVVVTMRQLAHRHSLDGLQHDAFMSVINVPVMDLSNNVVCIIHQIANMSLVGVPDYGASFVRSTELREIEERVVGLVLDLLKARKADLLGTESGGVVQDLPHPSSAGMPIPGMPIPGTFTPGIPIAGGVLTPAGGLSAGTADGVIEGRRRDLVMIAENRLDEVQHTRIAVKELGYRACVARDGMSVLRLWRQKHCGMILIDYQLPILDALNSARAIRMVEHDHFGHTPIIAICEPDTETSPHLCIEAGLDGLISKPVDKKQLQEVLNKWLPVAVQDG